MNKDVLDKIIDTAKQVLQDGMPIEKQIQFCKTMIGLLEKSIPEDLLKNFSVKRNLFHKDGDGYGKEKTYTKSYWSEFCDYFERKRINELWEVSDRFGVVHLMFPSVMTDDPYFDYVLYDVFRNEKERLEQIKGVEDFKQQLDDILTQLPTSTPEAETAETTPEAGTGNSNSLVFYCVQNESELRQIFDLLKKHKYIAPESVLDDWLAICGKSKQNNEIKPLEWIKSQSLLCCLINTMFVALNPNKVWKISQNVFTIKGGKINVNTMKTTLSRIKDVKPTQDWKDLENLLNLNNK